MFCGFRRSLIAFPSLSDHARPSLKLVTMSNYNAADIEVLQGLEPVQRRPGMYTDTTRPNHLAQEVIAAS